MSHRHDPKRCQLCRHMRAELRHPLYAEVRHLLTAFPRQQQRPRGRRRGGGSR